jgi:hypothetical protein
MWAFERADGVMDGCVLYAWPKTQLLLTLEQLDHFLEASVPRVSADWLLLHC